RDHTERATPRSSLFVLRFDLAVKRGHADAEHARRLLARTTAMRQSRFDYTALLLLNKFIESLSNRHCRHCLLCLPALRLTHDVRRQIARQNQIVLAQR